MSNTSSSASIPLNQDAGNASDLSSAPAQSPGIRLGDFSSIFDQCFAPDSEANKAGKAESGVPAIAPASPRASPRAAVLSTRGFSPDASARALRESPYKGGLLNGLDLSTIASPSGSVCSTPLLQDAVFDGDDDGDSDSDDVDIDDVDPRQAVGGLFDVGNLGRQLSKDDAEWAYGSGVGIASASTSPATAVATSAAARAVRSVVETPPFSNQLAALATAAMLSQPAYAGQPRPIYIPTSPPHQSPRQVRLPPTPLHRKTIPEKLDLVRALLLPESRLDLDMQRSSAVAAKPIHVIVDMSNICIGFVDKAKARHKLAGRYSFIPFSFEVLTEILVRGRSYDRLAAAGSVKDSNSRKPDHMVEAQKLGYDMSILGRVKKPDSNATSPHPSFVSFKEQAVDEVLHLKICLSVLDFEPATLVLATGDAKEAEFSDGFLEHVKRALKKGWCVELYSWKSNISRAWTNLQKAVPDQIRIIELDRFLDHLVGANPPF